MAYLDGESHVCEKVSAAPRVVAGAAIGAGVGLMAGAVRWLDHLGLRYDRFGVEWLGVLVWLMAGAMVGAVMGTAFQPR
jgi:hypothetical protein